MTIQEQLGFDQVDDETLAYLAAIGVDYLAIYPTPDDLIDGRDRLSFWKDRVKQAESHGLMLRNVASKCWDAITLGRARSEWDQVIVVQVDSPGAALCETLHELDRAL